MSEPVDGRRLEGFAELTRLGHSDERLDELHAQISEVIASIMRLDEIDVDGVEPAVSYDLPAEGDHTT